MSIGNKGYFVSDFEAYTNVFQQDFWEFNLSSITGIDYVTKGNNFFYPNPASDFITLNTNHTETTTDLTLNIYNISGELISSEAILQNQQNINISGLSNGIYIVEVKSKGGLEKQKLLVQK